VAAVLVGVAVAVPAAIGYAVVDGVFAQPLAVGMRGWEQSAESELLRGHVDHLLLREVERLNRAEHA
jgi:predicted phosphohydrolase